MGLCLTFTAYSDNTALHESDGVMNHGTQCNTYLMNRLVFHCAIVMQRAYRGLDARHRVGGLTMQGSLHSSTAHHRQPRLAINRFHSYSSRKATAVSGSTVGTDEKLPPEVRRGLARTICIETGSCFDKVVGILNPMKSMVNYYFTKVDYFPEIRDTYASLSIWIRHTTVVFQSVEGIQ